jgi:hypothetical protein
VSVCEVSVLLEEGTLEVLLQGVFEVMEPQGNYMEKLYGPGEYKLR